MNGEALLLGAGALLAATVSGATGFGFALVATALWSHRLEPRLVTTLALVYMLVLNIGYLPFFWRRIPWRRLAPNAKLRAMVVPQAPDDGARAAKSAKCEANCAHRRPVRLSWARLLKRVLAAT